MRRSIRTRERGPGVAAAILVLLLGASCGDSPKPVRLAIGYETTRLLEPQSPEGRIDYAAALNAAGAPPPQENAAVAIVRILGTDALVGDEEVVLAMLGAPPDLPAAGAFLPEPEDYWRAELDEMEGDELAVLSRWLAANQDPLDALVRASRSPRHWWPVVVPKSGLLEYALPVLSLGVFANALGLRAQLHLAQGRLVEGWGDAEALLRLYALDRREGMLARLVAQTTCTASLDWLARALETGKLDAQLCVQGLEALEHLPVRRDISNDVDAFDRYMVLHAFIRQVTDEATRGTGKSMAHPAFAQVNTALREVNRAFDELVPLLRNSTRMDELEVQRLVDARAARVKELGRELGTMTDRPDLLVQTLTTGGARVGSLIGEALAREALIVVPMVVERMRGLELRRRQVVLALALRLYVLEHAHFPATLAELVPGTIPQLPTHPEGAEPVAYERTEKGCRLATSESAIGLAR